ncbi:MAG: lytic transglycosylase domain-containing protein [Thermoproteota archaeon]
MITAMGFAAAAAGATIAAMQSPMQAAVAGLVLLVVGLALVSAHAPAEQQLPLPPSAHKEDEKEEDEKEQQQQQPPPASHEPTTTAAADEDDAAGGGRQDLGIAHQAATVMIKMDDSLEIKSRLKKDVKASEEVEEQQQEPFSYAWNHGIATGNSHFDGFDDMILQATREHRFPDPLVIKSQMHLESFFDVYAVSRDTPCEQRRPQDWSADEGRSYGLMQITPACNPASYGRWGMLLPDGHPNLSREGSPTWQGSVFNPSNNIPFGVYEMSRAYNHVKSAFPGCTEDDYIKMALSQYNASAGSVTGCGKFSEKGAAYVARVMETYSRLAGTILLRS